MLFNERKRLNVIEAAEADGQTFWTAAFAEDIRIRIWLAFTDATNGHPLSLLNAAEISRGIYFRSAGTLALAGQSNPAEDLRQFLLATDTENVPSIIEALLAGLAIYGRQDQYSPVDPRSFSAQVNEILLRGRISFELVDGLMVEIESQELHSTIVIPVLRLLSGRRGWDGVENAYQSALSELAQGAADDAITDACTALQETLTQLGCEGNALGPLIRSAKRKGLLAPHDTSLEAGITKFLDWASADRSELGDGHKGNSGAIREDAWLAVHVVGALILRLTGSPRRIR